MVGVMMVMATSFKGLVHALLYSAPLTPSKPLSTHPSAGDTWTLTVKSGSVSCGDTAPFSWLLVCALQESALVIPKHPLPNNTRDDSTHGHHQVVNTEIRVLILFAAKDREALHSQQKQDQELTVAQIMNSLLSNTDLKESKESEENH